MLQLNGTWEVSLRIYQVVSLMGFVLVWFLVCDVSIYPEEVFCITCMNINYYTYS